MPSSTRSALNGLMYSCICGKCFRSAPSVYVHGTVPNRSGGFVLSGLESWKREGRKKKEEWKMHELEF